MKKKDAVLGFERESYDANLESAIAYAKDYTEVDGGVWIIYDVVDPDLGPSLLVRSIYKPAPEGGIERGRVGPGPNGPFFAKWVH